MLEETKFQNKENVQLLAIIKRLVGFRLWSGWVEIKY